MSSAAPRCSRRRWSSCSRSAARHRGGAEPHRGDRPHARGGRRDRDLARAGGDDESSSDDRADGRPRVRGARGRRPSPPDGRRARPTGRGDRRARRVPTAETAQRRRGRARREDGLCAPGARGGREPRSPTPPPSALAAGAPSSRRPTRARRRERARGPRPPSWPVALAEKIVGAALDGAARARASTSSAARCAAFVERERVTVLVHPDDLELVQRRRSTRSRATLGGIEHCEVAASAASHAAALIVRTDDGEVDATRRDPARARARDRPRGARRSRPAHDRSAPLGRADGALARADLHRRHGRVDRRDRPRRSRRPACEAEVGEICSIETGRDAPAGARRGRRLPRRRARC